MPIRDNWRKPVLINRNTRRVLDALGDGHNIRVALEELRGRARVAHLQQMELLQSASMSGQPNSQVFIAVALRDER